MSKEGMELFLVTFSNNSTTHMACLRLFLIVKCLHEFETPLNRCHILLNDPKSAVYQ